MLTIKNVKTLDDRIVDYSIPSLEELTLDVEKKLLLLPGVIDPHISLGAAKSDRWKRAISHAVCGGITSLIEIPSFQHQSSVQELELKRGEVDEQLAELQIPLHYLLYGNGLFDKPEEIGISKKWIQGLVIQSDLLLKKEFDAQWENLFRIASMYDLPIILLLDQNGTEAGRIRSLEKSLAFIDEREARLYVLNVSSRQEIEIIQAGRKKSLLIYAETTPQYLFQNDQLQADCLWNALDEGVIETIGSGYDADRQSEERILFKGEDFDILNPLFLLPFLLTGSRKRKIPIEKLIRALKINIHDVFEISESRDVVLVDLEKERTIEKMGKNGPSAETLMGWPSFTILKGRIIGNTLVD